MGNDVDISRTRSVYAWDHDGYDDDSDDTSRKIEATVRSLLKRVAKLEQALEARGSGKAPQRHVATAPEAAKVRRPASGRAPTGGETMLHRRGKLRVRT
jgi:hypothetical protein